jgi:U6 snRNA-associated Sm-like protein LSm1
MIGGRGGGRSGGNHGRRSGGRDYHGGPGGGRGSGPPNYASPRPDNGGIGIPPPQPRLPRPLNEVPYGCLPAYLPGAASMVEQLDRRLLVILRDGRHLVGILRTFDQFSNMVLQETSERRILVVAEEEGAEPSSTQGGTVCYQTDIELGLFVVRGDSVVLFGEVYEDEEEIGDGRVRFVSLEEFERLQEEETRRKGESEERREEPIIWDFDMDLVA